VRRSTLAPARGSGIIGVQIKDLVVIDDADTESVQPAFAAQDIHAELRILREVDY
jgi:hypothetical protein